MDDENKSTSAVEKKVQEANPAPVASDDTNSLLESNTLSVPESHGEVSKCTENVSLEEEILTNKVNKVADYLEAIDLAGSVSRNKGQLPLWILVRSTIIFRHILFRFKDIYIIESCKSLTEEMKTSTREMWLTTFGSCR